MDLSADTTIFYPEADETPLPGGIYQLDHFVEIVSILKLFFKPREDVLVPRPHYFDARQDFV